MKKKYICNLVINVQKHIGCDLINIMAYKLCDVQIIHLFAVTIKETIQYNVSDKIKYLSVYL